MTPKEVAGYLRVHLNVVYDLFKKEGLPHARVGLGKVRGPIRVKKDWIDSWLEKRQAVNLI